MNQFEARRLLNFMHDVLQWEAVTPDFLLCGLDEYLKRRLVSEPGWPEGRPTWEEFWRNSYEGLVKLREALLKRGTSHGLVGDVPTCGSSPIG